VHAGREEGAGVCGRGGDQWQLQAGEPGGFQGAVGGAVFLPLDFTFVCPTELLAFSERQAEFKKLGAELLGVSVDSKYTHLAWMNTPRKQGGVEKLAYPLLADLQRKLATEYGVLTGEGVALRGLFIIDPDGVVQHATINNLAVGRSVEETLRVLQAFKVVREQGRCARRTGHREPTR